MACNESSNLSIPPIAAVANAFGLKTEIIENNGELDEKVRKALEYEGPMIIEVKTPIELTAVPKQVSYKRSDGQMESLPLEYMSPALSDEELAENMLIPLFEKS